MDRYDYILMKAKDLFEDSTTTKGIVSKNNIKNIQNTDLKEKYKMQASFINMNEQ